MKFKWIALIFCQNLTAFTKTLHKIIQILRKIVNLASFSSNPTRFCDISGITPIDILVSFWHETGLTLFKSVRIIILYVISALKCAKTRVPSRLFDLRALGWKVDLLYTYVYLYTFIIIIFVFLLKCNISQGRENPWSRIIRLFTRISVYTNSDHVSCKHEQYEKFIHNLPACLLMSALLHPCWGFDSPSWEKKKLKKKKSSLPLRGIFEKLNITKLLSITSSVVISKFLVNIGEI